MEINKNLCSFTEGGISVPHLILDAKRALLANAQFSALCITLALTDECAKVEWLKTHDINEKYNNETAYAHWYDMWMTSDGYSGEEKKQMEKYEKSVKNNRKTKNSTVPMLDGQLLYKIRCSILHALSSEIDFENCGLADSANRKITNFSFTLSIPNEMTMGGECCSCDKYNGNYLAIDLCGLINFLLYLIDRYYQKNKDQKFNFIAVSDFTNEYLKEEI